MFKHIAFFALLSCILTISPLLAQEEGGEVEVFMVESFIPPEDASHFHLAFYTTEQYKSKIVFADGKEAVINDSLSENHKIVLDISKVRVDSGLIKYLFVFTAEDGSTLQSENYDVRVPVEEKQTEQRSGGTEFMSCIYGGIIYLIPVIDYNIFSGSSKFGFSKELPVVSFFSGGFNYPVHYASVEYSHIPQAQPKNLFRVGWKYVYQVPFGEYVSPGLTAFTDFMGTNGIAPEVTWGMFSFREVFTVFARARYNTTFQNSGYSTLSVGLASWFFSMHQ